MALASASFLRSNRYHPMHVESVLSIFQAMLQSIYVWLQRAAAGGAMVWGHKQRSHSARVQPALTSPKQY
jgi:hypothetical protein